MQGTSDFNEHVVCAPGVGGGCALQEQATTSLLVTPVMLRGNSTKVTVAAVLEVGPDDVFLREAEYAKSASAHGGVYGDPRVSYQLRAFIEPHPTDSAGVCGESPMDSSRSLPSESSSSPGQEPNVHVSLTRL